MIEPPARSDDAPRGWWAPTLGGVQLASDVLWRGGWRIQRSALGGGHRLLDPRQRLRARGDLERCRAALERLWAERPPARAADHVVLLLHGLGRTRRSMGRIERALAAAGLEPAALSLATTRAPLERHVEDLSAVLAGLEARRVSFVTHSLGAIVARAALARPGPWRERFELGRAVLLGPPNAGSALARSLSLSPLARWPFRWVMGPTGGGLGRLAEDLPAPPCPFAIIAGARGTPGGWNPLIEGDDDGIVAVAETRLEGAADHLVVRRLHPVLMRDARVVEAVLRFLLEGRLRRGPTVATLAWPP